MPSDQEYHKLKEFVGTVSDIGGFIAFGLLIVAILGWLFGLPSPLPLMIFCFGLGVFTVFVCCRVYISNAQPVEGINLLSSDEPLLLEAPRQSLDPVLIPTTEQKKTGQLKPFPELPQGWESHYVFQQLQHNVKISSISMVPICFAKDDVITEAEPSGENNLRAIVVNYHNNAKTDPARGIAAIANVSAEVIYRHVNDGAGFTKRKIAWLSEKTSKVNFDRNDEHKLVVAIIEGTDNLRFFAVQREINGLHPEGITKRTELVGNLFTVNVCLVSDTSEKPINERQFILESANDETPEPSLVGARLWKRVKQTEFAIEGHELSNRILKGEKEEELVSEIREWETRVALFIGQHIREQEKTSFLNLRPSIDQGLRREEHLLPRGSVPGFGQWKLYDSIKVRIDRLDALSKLTH